VHTTTTTTTTTIMKIIQVALLAALSFSGASAFFVNHPSSATLTGALARTPPIVRYAAESDDAEELSPQDEEPSDVNSDEMMSIETTSMEDVDSKSKFDADKVGASNWDSKSTTLQKLLALSARTGRGEFASKEERDAALDLVSALEGDTTSLRGVAYKEKLYGRWELVYSSPSSARAPLLFSVEKKIERNERNRSNPNEERDNNNRESTQNNNNNNNNYTKQAVPHPSLALQTKKDVYQ
jgi:hypothetical protein